MDVDEDFTEATHCAAPIDSCSKKNKQRTTAAEITADTPIVMTPALHNMLQRAQTYGVDPSEQPLPYSAFQDASTANEPDYPIQLVPLDGGELTLEEDLLVSRLQNFFTRNLVRDRIMPVVQHNKAYSSRDLFWLVTNYFRERQTRYMVPDEEYPIRLADDYKAWIDHYGKANYDTYQRLGKQRYFNVVCQEDASFCFRETIAQMMWFEWAIRRLVCEYAEGHVEQIKKHQKDANERNKQRKRTEGKAFKRQPLTQAPQRSVRLYPGQVSLRVNY